MCHGIEKGVIVADTMGGWRTAHGIGAVGANCLAGEVGGVGAARGG